MVGAVSSLNSAAANTAPMISRPQQGSSLKFNQ